MCWDDVQWTSKWCSVGTAWECVKISLFIRYFPVREIYIQTSGFHHLHHHHQPKMENPGTTRVYCSVYIFTVNLQAITTYPPYLTTICRNDKITFTLEWQGKWSEVKHEWWKWFVLFYLEVFRLCLLLKYLACSVNNIDSKKGS